jgi:hypothetical protein
VRVAGDARFGRGAGTPPPPRFAWSQWASRLSRPSFGPPVNGGGSSGSVFAHLQRPDKSRLRDIHLAELAQPLLALLLLLQQLAPGGDVAAS